MVRQLRLGGLAIDVTLKNIKNIHLSVHPPAGHVRISAPARMGLETIRLYAVSKIGWIKQQQRKLQSQERETPREYVDRETHYVWGERCLLAITERDTPPAVELQHRRLRLYVRRGTDRARKQAIVEAWYRQQLKTAVQPLIALWEPRLGVRIKRLFIQRMKTQWGSSSISTRSIRLNTDLAKKPRQCLEYVFVHEMVHLIERKHNDRFTRLMDTHLPGWHQHRDALNRTPLTHTTWGY